MGNRSSLGRTRAEENAVKGRVATAIARISTRKLAVDANLVYLRSKIPLLREWIDRRLALHATQVQSITAFGFSRLPTYYSPGRVEGAKAVLVDSVPVPPLSAMGLGQFAAFEVTPFWAITYKDTYFIRRDRAQQEPVHFHEMVHIIQWEQLGIEPFLLLYALGLLQHGYENSPLEAMAYNHQRRFETSAEPYDVETAVRREVAGIRGPLMV